MRYFIKRIMTKLMKGKGQDRCKRCGACCLCGSGDAYHWCEYLFFKLDGTPTCMIYEERIGKKLVSGDTCELRYKTIYDYPGCPYNQNKQIHPFFKEKTCKK